MKGLTYDQEDKLLVRGSRGGLTLEPDFVDAGGQHSILERAYCYAGHRAYALASALGLAARGPWPIEWQRSVGLEYRLGGTRD